MEREERYKHYYNEGYNAGSAKGYEQAIDDAVKWLEKNVADIWNSPCNPDKIVELFRKAMKGGEE